METAKFKGGETVHVGLNGVVEHCEYDGIMDKWLYSIKTPLSRMRVLMVPEDCLIEEEVDNG